jgi:hypothetical protein
MTRSQVARPDRPPGPSSLADVADAILDKGLIVDASLRGALFGVEVLTIDARATIASIDTYLRFAEAVDRIHPNAAQAHGPAGLGSGHQVRRDRGRKRGRPSGSRRPRKGSGTSV